MNSFLYRRLCKWITCELTTPLDSKIKLSSKYEVASFSDVFIHPFYWQVFTYLKKEPQLVIDCGAHCGHFTLLSDICIRAKFSAINTKYILIEPNPFLIPLLKKNVTDASIHDRADIKQGLLGSGKGKDTLWINPKNYLTASLIPLENSNSYLIDYIDLQEVVGDRTIDLLKIDIEGGEYEFVPDNLRLLSQTNLVFIEIHLATKEIRSNLFECFGSVGLQMAGQPIKNCDHELLIFQRELF